MLISVVGTQITDNLSDNYGVSLVTTTIVFSIALAIVFADLVRERADAVDPHDLHDEARGLLLARRPLHVRARHRGRRPDGGAAERRLCVVARCSSPAAIALVAVAHYRFDLNAVLAFWIAYILTRPLGASIGDLLSQPRAGRRPRARDDRHELRLPGGDPRRGHVPEHHEA